jgi:hypothetical protein
MHIYLINQAIKGGCTRDGGPELSGLAAQD